MTSSARTKNSQRPETAQQRRSRKMIEWFRVNARTNGGLVPLYTTMQAARETGPAGTEQGLAVSQGQVQSRLNFLCFVEGLPPLELCASNYNPAGWRREPGCDWIYPLAAMLAAARGKRWTEQEFDALLASNAGLTSGARKLWTSALQEDHRAIEAWAYGFVDATLAHASRAGGRSASEGSVSLRLHKVRERDPVLADEFKKAQMGAHPLGRLICAACGFDPVEVYGNPSTSLIDVHHKIPVSEMLPNHQTTFDQLELLCPNCHRLAHSETPCLTSLQIKVALA